MAIYKYDVKNGFKYRAVTYINGKRYQKRGFRTKKEAQNWIDNIRGEGFSGTKATFREVAEMWYAQYVPTVRESTAAKTRTRINHCIDEFGDKSIESISVDDAQRFANKLSYEFISFKQIVFYASNIFDYAKKNNLVHRNPFKEIKIPKQHKKSEDHRELWTIDELNIFLNACKKDKRPFMYPLFRLIAYSGMRTQEVIALTWKDLQGDSIIVNKAMTINIDNSAVIGNTKNDSSNRIIILDNETVKILNEYKDKYGSCENERIFPCGRCSPYRWMKAIAEKEGLPPSSPHMLRHLHCTTLISSGAQIKDVQERLGHANIDTTLSIYLHATDEKKGVADLFEKAVSGTLQNRSKD